MHFYQTIFHGMKHDNIHSPTKLFKQETDIIKIHGGQLNHAIEC